MKKWRTRVPPPAGVNVKQEMRRERGVSVNVTSHVSVSQVRKVDDSKYMATMTALLHQSSPALTLSAGLAVENLCKSYPTPTDPLVVLKGGVTVSTSTPGERLAIFGPSGSGKSSTLLNIIGTLDDPTSGSVNIAGVNPFSFRAKTLASFRAKQIGFVFQDHHLLPQCNALEIRSRSRTCSARKCRKSRAPNAACAAVARSGRTQGQDNASSLRTLRRRAPARRHRQGIDEFAATSAVR